MNQKADQTLIAPHALVHNTHFISPAVITIKNGIIQNISKTIPKVKNDNTVMLDDTVLMPGFTNAHCHLELTSIGTLKNHNFVNWMKELIEAKIKQTTKDMAESILAGIKSLKDSGVTTILDHVGHDNPIQTYAKSDMRVIAFAEVLGSIPQISSLVYEKQKELKAKSPIPFHITPHTIHTNDEAILHSVFKNERPPFSIHMAEYESELEYFKNQSGPFLEYVTSRYPELKGTKRHLAPSPFRYLEKHNIKLNNSLIIHANYVDDIDLEIIKSWQNPCVIHCPGSFDFFKHGYFPFEEYQKNGIKVALGTDSLTSNKELNYISEIKQFLTKHLNLTTPEIMPLLTTNALESIGVKNVGKIEEGYQADIVTYHSKNTTPSHILEILSH